MKKHLLSILMITVLLISLMIPTAAAATAAGSAEVMGDADGDGVLTILDATAIQKHLAGTGELSEDAIRRCTVTGGSELTILDATAIQRKLAKIIDRFPAENAAETIEPTELAAHLNRPAVSQLTSEEQQVVDLINEIRVNNGKSPLSVDTELSRVALIKSQDMHDYGYFDHTSPTFGTPFEMILSYGIRYRAAAENIAYGYRTPQAVVNAWMNSDGHRENILSDSYTAIGIGYVADGSYWTLLFIG